ncbi:MAG: hypothetical protein EA412_01670 [Chitinophagaceae bacterium]|nr:MAG: hypothetical protein EA412_01670 [Chitinophagaceae bacterium]
MRFCPVNIKTINLFCNLDNHQIKSSLDFSKVLRYFVSLMIVSLALQLASINLSAQTFSGNEWIDYSKRHYKVKVAENGIYRIPYSVLNSLQGLNLNQVAGGDLIFFRDGSVIPYYTSNTGILGPGDYIEFYGEKNDGRNEEILYEDYNHQLHPHFSLYNDTATYYFRPKTASESNRLITTVSNNLTNPPAKENYFLHSARNVLTSVHNRGNYSILGGQRLYKSTFNKGEGFVGPEFNKSTYTSNLSTPGIYNQGPSATVNIAAVSTSNSDHNFIFQFNGITLKDEQFFGYRMHKDTFTVPISSLQSTNTFSFLANGSGSVDRNNIALMEITYPRTFNFNNQQQFKFNLSAQSGERFIEILNFDHQNSTPVLYDLTNNIRLTGQAGSSTQQFRLPAPNNPNQSRSLVINNQASGSIKTVTSISHIDFTDITATSNQANYVIISNSVLFSDNSGVNRVEEYRQYRSSMTGGGYNAKIYNIDELYDQFAYGVRKSPLAIRNFINYAASNWGIRPQHILLIGKGRTYSGSRFNFNNFQNNLIPSFGEPASDVLLAAAPNTFFPRVPIGRIPVTNGADLKNYLEKVKQFEQHQAETGDPHQTIDNKAWMKQALHLGGGNNNQEQNLFRFYLNNYKEILEDTLFGGAVTEYFKTSSSPIQIAQSQQLKNRIDNGVSLITFFGHSNPNSFDIALDDPENYTNFGKYPIILSNGCFSGNIFGSSKGISERFTLTPDRGAIAFLSTLGLSAASGLNVYSERFYKFFAQESYGTTLGEVIRKTVQEVDQCCSNSVFNTMIALEMTLNGDPALRINPHAKPDYVLEPQNISFQPSQVTINMDSFDIEIIVANIGRAVKDSIILQASREFPDGSSLPYRKKIKAPYFMDTVVLRIPMESNAAMGVNIFRIKIDADDEIDELSETNNEIVYNLNIVSDDVLPAYPYDFAIVPYQNITLKASTANPFAPVRDYIIEIDTTELFNSPLKQSTTINQMGGVLKWTPNLVYVDSTVYYWRVGIKAAQGQTQEFRYSSFIFLDNNYPGWNQSHYYQFLKDSYFNMYLDNDRKFKYVDDIKEVRIVTGHWQTSGLHWDNIAYYLNGVRMQYWNCGGDGFGSGLSIAVFDSVTGEPWVSEYDPALIDLSQSIPLNPEWGNFHCKPRDFFAFDFRFDDAVWRQRVIDFLNAVPNGNYVMIQSINNPDYSQFGPDLLQILTDLGSNEAAVLPNLPTSNVPWVFFGQKGNPGIAQEQRGQSPADVLDMTATFEVNWYAGRVTSTVVGPASEWQGFYWNHASQGLDSTSVKIFGISPSGAETVIFDEITDNFQSLSSIDANQYPKIRLQMFTQDDSLREPSQLDYWRVLYDKLPDAAINPAAYFEFVGDTINLGEDLILKVAVENLTNIPMDSMLIKYTVNNAINQSSQYLKREQPLDEYESFTASFNLSTNNNNFKGLNSLSIEINPDNDQPEMYHFNNVGVLQFRGVGDNMNPLLDVTFDGVHIMDGEMVSSEPEIRIKLKDENPFLMLDDTTLFNVFIEYPNGELKRINFNEPDVSFIPASSGSQNNEAEVILRRKFPDDGIYRLKVQAQDRSNNISGYYGNPEDGMDYKISYEISNKSMISNIVNYPNPFSTSTQFVFTLTGNKVPDFMKIQIMTVTGKIVREIMMNELGPIRIGNNRSEFRWDGTDQFGDRLANGLYLYRVVATIDGQSIDRLETSADRFFHSGFGKMYIAR